MSDLDYKCEEISLPLSSLVKCVFDTNKHLFIVIAAKRWDAFLIHTCNVLCSRCILFTIHSCSDYCAQVET